MQSPSFPRACSIFATAIWLLVPLVAVGKDAAGKTRVLIVVGPSSHPPGTHEVAAGGRLMKHCLENAPDVDAIRADVVTQWPSDAAVRAEVDSVVFIGDLFPPHQMEDATTIMTQLGEMMDRGGSIVCIHFATGLRDPNVSADGAHPLLNWMGGYFASRCAHHRSIARIFPQCEILPATAGHPISRGWKPFTLHDEPYIENYFGTPEQAAQSGLIELATSMLPPEAPQRQVVAWGVERPDGGRGFAIVMPHYYHNWALDDLRTLILNGIVWSAGRDIPAQGVRVDLPDLGVFEPSAQKAK